MASETEPAKLLLPYLQRADELQKHEPLVAYYCRLYAMERGLKIPQKERTKMTNSVLVSIMNQLEKDKKSLVLGPDDKLHVEGFASSVFAKADKQDRAGRADLNTAKTFYAASIFFEVLGQFGDEQPDLEQKQKYAVWKAADIRKALKEGRKPVPGPPGGDKDLSVLSSTSSGEYDLELSRSNSSIRFDANRTDPTTSILPDSDLQSPPHPYHKSNSQQPTNLSPHLSDTPTSPNPSISPRYPTYNFYQPPPSEHSTHPHSYPQHHNPSQDLPSYPYPNSQSYPGYTESTLPTVPSHHPSYNQGSSNASSYSNYSPGTQYDSVARNDNVPEVLPVSRPRFEYDSSYQPLPEQIAEAHKAARFAVGALAFDDVAVAVDFLSKSLELLTKPSPGQ